MKPEEDEVNLAFTMPDNNAYNLNFNSSNVNVNNNKNNGNVVRCLKNSERSLRNEKQLGADWALPQGC